MNEERKEEHSHFFKEMKKFKEKQNKQKVRGLNDYNLLTTVLSADDEVRLHSRMLHSLLDPNGLHYQGSLFLELFFDILGFKDKKFEIEKARVELEYKHIDLHITDGKKHIIIENKIHASDQESQIKRYIEKIIKPEDEDTISVLPENITVIYLSIDRKKPSDYSLGKIDNSKEYFELSNDGSELQYKGSNDILKDSVIKFKSIHYQKDIVDWLKRCQYEVQNITNLNEAIRQYKEVVEIISNKYESKCTQMKDFLGKINSENLEIASKIYKEPDTYKSDNEELVEDILNHFLRTVDERYQFVAIKIVDEIKRKFDEAISNKIRNVKGIILNGEKRYANNHYIDLVLENEIRIQLMYRNDFKLIRINVYNIEDNPAIAWENDFKIKNLYKLLTSEELIDELCTKHANDDKLIDEIKKLILKYDQELPKKNS